LQDSAGEFVQYGWYEGAATGLPYSSVPRVFFGESNPAGGERLTPGPVLAAGSTHNFRILWTSSGGYHMFLDGAYTVSNALGKTARLNLPFVDGETDVLCTEMDAVAHRNPYPPNPTLYWATGTIASPTWKVFTTDTYSRSADAAAHTFASTDWNGNGTFFGFGGG
jgi:hypothetical protein